MLVGHALLLLILQGLLVLCAWGLPPMFHTDDAVRAVAASFDLVENLKVCRCHASCVYFLIHVNYSIILRVSYWSCYRLSVISHTQRLGDGVHGRVGVATGRAFCGVVGSHARREYTVGVASDNAHTAADGRRRQSLSPAHGRRRS